MRTNHHPSVMALRNGADPEEGGDSWSPPGSVIGKEKVDVPTFKLGRRIITTCYSNGDAKQIYDYLVLTRYIFS